VDNDARISARCEMRKVVSQMVPALPKGNLRSTSPQRSNQQRALVPKRKTSGRDFNLAYESRQKLATSVGPNGRQMQWRNLSKFSTNVLMITFFPR
jgi:hypothetical protein